MKKYSHYMIAEIGIYDVNGKCFASAVACRTINQLNQMNIKYDFFYKRS